MSLQPCLKELSGQALTITMQTVPLCQALSILSDLPQKFKDIYLQDHFSEAAIMKLHHDPFLNDKVRPFFQEEEPPSRSWMYHTPKDLLTIPQLRHLHFKIKSITKDLFDQAATSHPSLNIDNLTKLLVVASENNLPEITRDILASPHYKPDPERLLQALLKSISDNHYEVTTIFLESSKFSLLPKASIKRALYLSVNLNKPECILRFLERLPPSFDGVGYALQLAAEQGFIESLHLILRYKEKFNIPSIYINEAFVYAAAEGRRNVLEVLNENFGTEGVSSFHRQHAITMAYQGGHHELATDLARLFSLNVLTVLGRIGPVYLERFI